MSVYFLRPDSVPTAETERLVYTSLFEFDMHSTAYIDIIDFLCSMINGHESSLSLIFKQTCRIAGKGKHCSMSPKKLPNG